MFEIPVSDRKMRISSASDIVRSDTKLSFNGRLARTLVLPADGGRRQTPNRRAGKATSTI